ncbi:nitrilase-related carbon-nitrogen hydrolase [Tropicimonas sediminicola]|uniref:Predicted amidohydrolase n=1 Tax=Tropicimonas sediminicola TaxID=1031541 RepID=A0A239D821_9RHOB|nr:nitrilase-related carbon-nitrogen hydrolase [Tropicimonas sediminicola]SNS27723.1 Predicted amidohydrolase [Tropicimonas sediminicola]
MHHRDTLRCACAQIEHKPHDPDALFTAHIASLEEAHDRQVDLVTFPETSLTGYPPGGGEVRKMAIWADDRRLLALAAKCRNTYAVVGFVEHGRGGHFYNSIAWLHKGEVLKVYRKINLPTYGRLDEGKYFTAGKRTQTIDIDRHWICGGMICADSWDPGQLYLSAMRESTVLALPIASTKEAVGGGFSNEQGWDIVARYTAMIYGLPILLCNWTGPHLDMNFWGGSSVYGPDGRKLASASGAPEMICADVRFADVVHARQTMPTVRTLMPQLLLRELPGLLE